MTIALLAAAAASGLAAWALVDAALAAVRKRRSLRHLEDFETITVAKVRQRELEVPLRERVLQPGLRRLAELGQAFTPVGVVERLDETLVHAAISGWDGPRFLAVKLLSTFAGAFIGLVIAPSLTLLAALLQSGPGAPGGRIALQSLVFAGFGAVVGYYLPEWIVRGRAQERSEDIRKTLPDALDLLSISVSAGLGFEAAMDRVARELRGELGVELYRTVQEMRLGQGRADALRGLSARTNVPELDSFVVSMVQAEAFGVPIARVLRTQADELRMKRRQRAEEAAQKIPVKILFPLVATIFPVLFIVVLGPAAITIYQNVISQP